MGWAGRVRDDCVRTYLSKHDILLLQETWTTEYPTLEGFKAYGISAEPSNHGRAKGGLGILISTALKVKVNVIPSNLQSAMVIIVQYEQISCVIINVYHTPLKTKQHVLHSGFIKFKSCLTSI